MTAKSEFQLDNVWQDKSPEVKEEIIQFWLDNKALGKREQAEQRLPQVAFVARDADGKLAGVSTVYPQRNERLGHEFYYFRCFVAEPQRRQRLAVQLILAARDHFNARFAAGDNPNVIGMIVEVQNEFLRKNRREAVWPNSKFIFVGRNRRGDPVRVFYFDGAMIAE